MDSVMKIGQPYQSPRQHMWMEIRKRADDFTLRQIVEFSKNKRSAVQMYINALRLAGYVIEIYRKADSRGCGFETKHFRLINDAGYNAPEINQAGNPSLPAIKNKAMWNTLRITGAALTSKQLAQFASTNECVISHSCAATYLTHLHKAGYLSKTGQKYQLLKKMNTGSRPPMVKKTGQVFDPNISKFMEI